MGFIHRTVVLPVFDTLSFGDAERAHELAIAGLRAFGQDGIVRSALINLTRSRGLDVVVNGMHFPNPLGMAAGFDKHGLAARALEMLGFGFVVSGTVTPRPQVGNPKPRLFRLKEDRCIINRLGFNSCGASQFKENIRMFGRPTGPFGISVGPNKETPSDNVAFDINLAIIRVYDCGDFFIVNVSSPNTPGLRSLQDPALLVVLLKSVQANLVELALKNGETRKKPLWVKLAPDLTWDQLDATLGACEAANIDAIVYGNTTIERPSVINSRHRAEKGGLSGPVLFTRMCAAMKHIERRLPHIPRVGVGGIDSPDKALHALEKCGATLVKLHTGLITEGPMLPSQITRGMWMLGYRTNVAGRMIAA